MPEETIAAFQDHGRIEARLETELDAPRHLLRELSAAGIDYDDVVATLEREGIERFVAAYGELVQSIAARRRVLAPAG
jgi:transaldolase